jgi:WD40 repeat protein
MASDAVGQGKPQSKAKVFISYSRKDMAFADRLDTALKVRGFEPLIDRTEIYAFEEWWKRIEALIGQADTIVFVLSPDAVRPDSVARKEVAFAASQNKRFAPIVYRPVEDKSVPEELAKLNFIFFDDPARFERSAAELVEALNTDIGWIRQHTDFGEQARRWVLANGPSGLLLRSPVLEQAERWITARPSGAPAPTEDTQTFIRRSRRAAMRRRNILTGSLAAGLVLALCLAGLAYWQRGIAVEQREMAIKSEARAIDGEEQAKRNEAQAKAERDRALLTQSRFLADVANQRVAADDAGTGVLLALDALPDPPSGIDRPYAPEAEAALFGARPRSRELGGMFWGPNAPVVSASFSPDGRTVAMALANGTVQIWEPTTVKTAVLTGHSGPVLTVAFSPDGRQLITGSLDRTARIWDVASRQTLMVLTGHSDRVWSAAFRPDGLRVVTGSSDQTARIWDAETGKSIFVLGGSSGTIRAEFSPDGHRVVTASNQVQIWDADTGRLLGALSDKSGGTITKSATSSAAFSPDGQRVVTGSGENAAYIWDVASGRPIATLAGHSDRLRGARYSSDGRRIVTASYDGTARVWDAESGTTVCTLHGHAGIVWDADFSPDGRQVVTASSDRTARIWALELGSPEIILRASASLINAEFSSDARRVITAAPDAGTVQFWDPDTAQQTSFINVSPMFTATLSQDGRTLAIASASTARILDVQTGKTLVVLTGHSDMVWSLAFSPDGRRVVTSSKDKTARVWDAGTGSTVTVLKGHEDKVEGATFSLDGQRVVTASDDGTAHIWNVESGETIRVLKGHVLDGVPIAVIAARFSPDGRWVVTGSDDHTARIWDAETGETSKVLQGHTDVVWSVAFSPDQRRVVTASRDKTARIWDVATGKTIAVLAGHTADVWAAHFSADGLRVLTASLDQTARIWRLYPTTQALIEDAKRVVPRCLTRRQRERFFLDAEPPPWCIDLMKWPYHTKDWKDWLAAKRGGLNPPLPEAPEWQ